MIQDMAFLKVHDDAGCSMAAALAERIWPEHFSSIIGMPQVTYMLKKFQSSEAIREYIRQGFDYYIVVIENIPSGYISVRFQSEGLFLSKFYLLAASRGQGVGRRMMDFVITLAKSRQVLKIFLNINKNNSSTISFYEHLGFKKVSSSCQDLGNGFVADDWVMEKQTRAF